LIEIGLKLVEKDGLGYWSCSSSQEPKFYTHLDDQFDQYMFVLRISIFEMTALISCTSNTILDINRPFIGGERWFGIFATTAALMFSPQQAPRFYKPS
jgi:hypothetical protein